MSSIIEKESVMLVSSLAANGATNINSNGNVWNVNIQDGLNIPSNAAYCYLTVPEATIWYNTPNISAALGNNVIYYEHATVDYTITIPDGLYDLDHLNQEIVAGLTNETAVPNDLFELTANTATEKASIHFLYATTQIDFTQTDTFRLILGFDSRLVPLAGVTTSEVYEEADNIAAFNTINYYLIHCDIISKGIRINNAYDRIISRVLIDQPPGSQLVQRKENPEKIDCSELIHQYVRNFNVRVTDNNNNNIDTLGEEISFLIVLHYGIPVQH